MNGETALDEIVAFAVGEHSEEAGILEAQIRDFSARSLLVEGNDAPQLCPNSASPKYIYLTLTDRCNLKCAYCYAEERRPSPELTLTQWVSIVDRCVEAFGPLAFTFTGGEPLLVEYVFDLASHIRKQNCSAILLTNGVLLSQEKDVKRAAEVFSQIRISLDSTDEKIADKLRGQGVTKKALAAYRNLVEHGNTPIVQCTVCTENQHTIGDVAAAFGSNCNFQPLISIGRAGVRNELAISGEGYFAALTEAGATATLPGYRNSIDRFRGNAYKRCALAIEELSFGPNGDLFPCHMMHYEEARIGNVLVEDISTLYSQSEILQSIRKLNVDSIETCKTCLVRNFCGTGCRARIGIRGIDPSAHDPFCEFERESILDALFGPCQQT